MAVNLNTRWHVFYTPEYEQLALGCVESARSQGLLVMPVPYANSGNWEQNCMLRPALLLERFAGPVGMIDADARFVSPPDLLHQWTGDVLVHRNGDPVYARTYSAGVVAFAGAAGMKVLADWAARCQSDSLSPKLGLHEQHHLHAAMEKAVRVQLLPPIYCHVPAPSREEAAPPSSAVIVHLPASRKMKCVVDKEVQVLYAKLGLDKAQAPGPQTEKNTDVKVQKRKRKSTTPA